MEIKQVIVLLLENFQPDHWLLQSADTGGSFYKYWMNISSEPFQGLNI